MATAKNAADLLCGVKAIADHLGMTERQVKHQATTRGIPTFKMGAFVCASKSYLAEHFRKLSEEANGDRR